MYNRPDCPMVDTDESFVYFNSPSVAVLPSGRVHHAELGYGWDAREPFLLQMSIMITSGSVMVNEQEFPDGLICQECLLPIEYGTVACTVSTDSLTDEIWCIACGRDRVEMLDETTWNISLDMVREAVADRADYEPANGSVRITRPTADTTLFRFGAFPAEHMYLNVPATRLGTFLSAIDAYLADGDLAAVTDAYLDAGFDMLERLANNEA